MEEKETHLGRVRVGTQDEIFAALAEHINAAAQRQPGVIGLTGGSTPKAFYTWAVERRAILDTTIAKAIWSVSDERHVELESDESNFGNADRMMLTPLAVPGPRKWPFRTMVDPHSAAEQFNREWMDRAMPGQGLSLCILGMGDDGHTASIFPGSPLLGAGIQDPYASVEVPGKGWRVTITEHGLGLAQQILVVVTGAGKVERLKTVFGSAVNPSENPVQLVHYHAGRVEWLLDIEAGVGV